jgi:thiamine-phosphate pyrophosphorylase
VRAGNPHNPVQGKPLPIGLYGICDDGVSSLSMVKQAELLLEGGVRVVQARLKRTPTRQAVPLLKEVVGLCRAAGAVCLVNDRVDWALLAAADGVHLGDDDLAPQDARRLLGPTKWVGATVRSAAGAQAAQAAGADYVGVGPVFATATKVVPAPVLGVEGFARVCSASPLPVVGIGGVGLSNIEQVAAAGARMAAVVSDLLRAPDLPARARALQHAFERGATS